MTIQKDNYQLLVRLIPDLEGIDEFAYSMRHGDHMTAVMICQRNGHHTVIDLFERPNPSVLRYHMRLFVDSRQHVVHSIEMTGNDNFYTTQTDDPDFNAEEAAFLNEFLSRWLSGLISQGHCLRDSGLSRKVIL